MQSKEALIRTAAALAVVVGGLAIKPKSPDAPSAQADSTTADLNYKTRLPVVIVNLAETTPTPVPENPALKDTVLVEKLEAQLNGQSYTIESRITADALYHATFNPATASELVQLVAKDGQSSGSTRTVIVITNNEKQMPAGNSLNWTQVNVDGKWYTIGKVGSQRISPTIMAFEYLPTQNMNLSNPTLSANLNYWLALDFLRTTEFGDAVAPASLDQEHFSLLKKGPITISSR